VGGAGTNGVIFIHAVGCVADSTKGDDTQNYIGYKSRPARKNLFNNLLAVKGPRIMPLTV
jgi:hypothetical protein